MVNYFAETPQELAVLILNLFDQKTNDYIRNKQEADITPLSYIRIIKEVDERNSNLYNLTVGFHAKNYLTKGIGKVQAKEIIAIPYYEYEEFIQAFAPVALNTKAKELDYYCPDFQGLYAAIY